MTPSRRSFITGLAALVATPAIVRASSLMPVRGLIMDVPKLVVNYDIYAELANVTRQAFVPRLYVQLYHASPMMALMAELQAEQPLDASNPL